MNYNVSTKVKVRKINVLEMKEEYCEDEIAIEAPVQIILNGDKLATIMATPSQLENLAIGFLIDEGLVKRYDDIIRIKVNRNKIYAQASKINQERLESLHQGFILSSCGSREDFINLIKEGNVKVANSKFKTNATNVIGLVKVLVKKSAVFRKTGGVHSAALFDIDNLIAFAEDVGRHNAVDKVIGSALSKKLSLSNSILITSGRQPSDIIMKAARVNIPISVSLRAPVSSGVYAAEMLGLTLVCFARGSKMNVYSGNERILLL